MEILKGKQIKTNFLYNLEDLWDIEMVSDSFGRHVCDIIGVED